MRNEEGVFSSDEYETDYEKIYSIKLFKFTLREVLLFKSLLLSKTQSDIVQLVKEQPSPQIFFKSSLEFDCTNLVSVLSFDSRSMTALLGEDNKEYFSDEFPIFYLNKINKTGSETRYFYRTAIDRALKANQVRAVSLMIDYIVKNQNNYTASYLFNKNVPDLLEKGIQLHGLFASNIFMHTFDNDQWPGSHPNDETASRPYNDSLFKIRDNYRQVFHEDKFKLIEDHDDYEDHVDT